MRVLDYLILMGVFIALGLRWLWFLLRLLLTGQPFDMEDVWGD